jgi:VanZ family protein
MTDEYHQSFSPGRTPSVRDVIIDTCGALTFLTIAYFLTRFVKHDEKN